MPAPDEKVPPRPQPQCEQRPLSHRIPHDHPEHFTEGRQAANPGEGQALPGEQGAEQQGPDQITNQRVGPS